MVGWPWTLPQKPAGKIKTNSEKINDFIGISFLRSSWKSECNDEVSLQLARLLPLVLKTLAAWESTLHTDCVALWYLRTGFVRTWWVIISPFLQIKIDRKFGRADDRRYQSGLFIGSANGVLKHSKRRLVFIMSPFWILLAKVKFLLGYLSLWRTSARSWTFEVCQPPAWSFCTVWS